MFVNVEPGEDSRSNSQRGGLHFSAELDNRRFWKNKVSAAIKIGLHLPILPTLEASVQGDAGKDKTKSTTFVPLELDLEDVNYVIRALKTLNFTKYLVLEDFHYLPDETQRLFADALKAYTELSQDLTFVVVGVWLEHDRLAMHNGDLAGRIVSVNVDEWSPDDLMRVITKREELLNVKFSQHFKNQLIEKSQESVYIVQEVCNRACLEAGIFETQDEITHIPVESSAADLVKAVVDLSAARYSTFLQRYSDGFKETDMQMHRWILFPLLNASIAELQKGLLYSKLRSEITKKHPEGASLNLGNLTIALGKVASLQVFKKYKAHNHRL